MPTTHPVGDITYLKTGEGWLYLATVIDLNTRMVVGRATAADMKTPLIIEALTMAHGAGYVAGNAIFHSPAPTSGSGRNSYSSASTTGSRYGRCRFVRQLPRCQDSAQVSPRLGVKWTACWTPLRTLPE